MFLKIFLTFWLTVALLAAGQEIVSMIAQRDAQSALEDARRLVAEAQAVVDGYGRGGVAAARAAADDLEARRKVAVDLLDRRLHSLFDRDLRPAVIATARRANEIAGAGSTSAAVNLGEHVAAKRMVTASGEPLTLVVELPGHGAARAASGWALSPLTRYGAVLLVGGALCFLLARHLSKPLVTLTAAANALADGRLDTRVGRPVAGRHDEVGRLAHNFDRMAERIEALVAGQRRLFGDVSHELRSPLARLSVAAGLARRGAPAEASEYFDRIDIETARLDRLIEQLLTLARIESGVDDELRTINLTELVQEVVSDGDFEARASGKRVTLASADPVVLYGRADLLRSSVENIVRNAIRYTAAGQPVEVSLTHSPNGGPEQATLTVRDHGPGVPSEAVSDMFRRFWRGNDDPVPAPDGAGLGLAIADSVVRRHGGTISAANAAGGGLLVTINLPMTQ
jgi:two-component system sensor histidine kinase CpxA